VIGAFLSGLCLQASLIVAIGPQNAFVLRQGLRREHAGSVVALCTAADVLLLCAGAAGLTAVVAARPALWALLRWTGVAALTGYGFRALLRGLRPGALGAGPGAGPRSRCRVLAQAASFTFLNPHVYLDALLLAGGMAAAQPLGGAPWFVAGASLASAAWFVGLGLAAQALAPLLARPAAWRLLDVVTGSALCALAVRLAAAR